MEIIKSKNGEVAALSVSGRLDASTASELEKSLIDLFDAGEKFFLVDFAGLEYISSVGLRVLLMSAKKAKAAGGKVVLSGLQEHVSEVFEIAGFTAIFEIFDDSDAALASF